jgi:hypothetical protein
MYSCECIGSQSTEGGISEHISQGHAPRIYLQPATMSDVQTAFLEYKHLCSSVIARGVYFMNAAHVNYAFGLSYVIVTVIVLVTLASFLLNIWLKGTFRTNGYWTVR